jgi:predicted Zn-dependent protease with MMP-like domain
MKRISYLPIGALVAMALVAAPAHADDPAGTPPSDPTAKAAETLQSTANPQAETHAGDVLAGIRERAAKVNVKANEKWNADVAASVAQTDKAGTADGRQIATRLGTEFGMSPDAITTEKSDLNTSWGELMIAHTLMANSTTDVTAKDLLDMRTQGMGWGQIAIGMGFHLGDAISAAKAEGRVANGLDKADGNVATIHGPNARSGPGATKAESHAAAKVGARGAASTTAATEHAKLGVGAGAGVGRGADKSGK